MTMAVRPGARAHAVPAAREPAGSHPSRAWSDRPRPTRSRWLPTLFACVALSQGLTAVQAQSISGVPFIAVHGKASQEVVPDVFPLEITLEDTSLDAARAQATIESLAGSIVRQAEAAGVRSADMEIASLTISPEYKFNQQDDTQVFLGNSYRRTIQLRFHALADLARFIGELPEAKQLKLETGTFASSRSGELRLSLLAAAVDDARKTAEAMAGAVGRRVGAVHNVSNQGFNVRYVDSSNSTELDRIEVSGSRLRAPDVVLREGTISLDQSVYIIYTLVD